MFRAGIAVESRTPKGGQRIFATLGVPDILRLALRTSVLLLALSLTALGNLRGAENGQDWPRFLGPLGNGISPETGLLEKWPTNGPPLLWEKEIGAGYGAPSVRGDKLVFHHRLRDEEIVECVDAATGKPRWRYAYPSHFIDPFGYNNGPLYTLYAHMVAPVHNACPYKACSMVFGVCVCVWVYAVGL